jgi:hypothetical protein
MIPSLSWALGFVEARNATARLPVSVLAAPIEAGWKLQRKSCAKEHLSGGNHWRA